MDYVQVPMKCAFVYLFIYLNIWVISPLASAALHFLRIFYTANDICILLTEATFTMQQTA